MRLHLISSTCVLRAFFGEGVVLAVDHQRRVIAFERIRILRLVVGVEWPPATFCR